jgi:hypothetical protein
MDYKKVVNEQINILQKKQNELIKNGSNRADLICLYADTISKIAETASNLKNQPIEATKGVKKDAKEQKATTQK